MRTTLTLDDDVFLILERLQKETGSSFRELVNASLRRGLEYGKASGVADRPENFATPTRNLGACRYASLDNVQEILSIAEGEGIR